jgi:RNA polymerase sigma-70 factor (ECF subfamily)
LADEDADLMNRYCDGDAAAFRQLYARLAPRILAYLVALMADRSAAEDLLQQTFLKLHQSRSTYVRNANPVPWLYTIAHRTCLDEIRRRRRTVVKLTSDGELPREPRAALSGEPEEPDARADAGEGESRISLADLDALPPNQREALLLTKVHGHSISEAASIAGTTPGAIKLRAHRAYVTLRQRAARQAKTARTAGTAAT